MQVITNPIKLRRDSGSGKLKSNADTRPDPFYFTAQTDVSLDTLILSNTVTISGLGAAAIIKIIGGEYLIDGGSWTSAQGTISNGQTLQSRVNSSIEFSEPTTATVNVGGFSAAFTVTTAAEVGPGVLIGLANWEDGNVTPPSGGYGGADWSVYVGGASSAAVTSGVLRVTNPNAIPENDVVIGFGHPDLKDHFFVHEEWRWVSTDENMRHGVKNFKAHGKLGGVGYANATYGLEAGDTPETNAAATRMSFGDGTVPDNDTGFILKFDGTNKELTGRNFTTPGAILDTPQNENIAGNSWGTGWNVSRYKGRFNSGTTAENEVPNGLFYIEHNGLVYIDMRNIFNRYYGNLGIDYLSWIDVAQDGHHGYVKEIRLIKISLNDWV